MLKDSHSASVRLPRIWTFIAIMLAGLSSHSTYAQTPTKIDVFGVRLVGIYGKVPKELVIELRDLALQQIRAKANNLSLEELEVIGDSLTLRIREEGYGFSYAFLPHQKVVDGAITFQIVLGRLGDINIIDANSEKTKETLHGEFADLVGMPAFDAPVEKRISDLQADPRIEVFGFYSRGKEPGEARLNLKVRRFDEYHGVLVADNYGSETTGEKRVGLHGAWFNPLGNFDQLSLGIVRTISSETDEKNTYGYLGYELPLASLSHRLNFFVANNLFVLGNGFETLELKGDARVAQLGYTWHGSGSTFKQTLGLSTFFKETDYSSALNDRAIEPDEEVVGGTLSWQGSSYIGSPAHRFNTRLAFSGGEYDEDSRPLKGEAFYSEEGSLRFDSDIFLGAYLSSRLSFYVRGQFTDRRLPSTERASLSGAYAVRSVKAGYFNADRLALGTVEYRLTRWLRGDSDWRWAPLLAFDSGYAESLSDRSVSARAQAEGVAGGIELFWRDSIRLKLLGLDALYSKASNGAQAEEIDVLGELAWSF